MSRAVAYFRVSTLKQGQSGLGLEAQEQAVRRYVEGQRLTLVASYTEHETGTSKRQRVEIHRAIERAKAEGAVLLIAKLDRLSRNLHFVSGLLESGVRFVAVDMPQANNLTIQLMAVLAEHEANAISTRTREALAAAKARGVRLGCPVAMTEEVRSLGRAKQREMAIASYANVYGYVALMRQSGMSFRSIAQKLTEEGFRTRRGKAWTAPQVVRVLQRMKEQEMPSSCER